ncbi:MAG TPA: glycosyltransferase family 4 protein [Acidimicrobiales bacterium]|nr:glycosyltransferase family 4 protein [Acidimicrobiales bacterium]
MSRLRVLMAVQRYGREISGGAEQLCRDYATQLVARGHTVDVVTTRASSYVDWADSYPEGIDVIDGVQVHRLSVARPRNHEVFAGLQARVVAGPDPVPWYLQREWMRQQGPNVPELIPWLQSHAADYDVRVFFTYLYDTTWSGLPVAAHYGPTVFHPTAHDEPPFRLSLFEPLFRQADAFGFLTAEEMDLVLRRFRLRPPCALLGIGVDQDAQGDADSFRRRYGLEERPYLLYIGRIDPHKGSDELFDQFLAYKQRHPGPLALVFLGPAIKELPEHPDVIVTGHFEDQDRWDALAGCVAYVNPSYFESFSRTLTEAWALGRPALVQGHCAVLEGQARRSGGALPYRGFGEFEAAVELVIGNPSLGDRLGRSGRRYVEAHYRWEEVTTRYERLLFRAATTRPRAA